MATDPSKLFQDTVDAYTESVGHQPNSQEMVEIERVVAQEIKDQYDGKK